MAELNTSTDSAGSAKIRSRKLHSKVDLTAMVDLAFLLITFFMLTTSLSKPRSMDLTMPEDLPAKPMAIDENLTMTIVVDRFDRAHCFMGMLSKSSPTHISLNDHKALRREVLRNKGTASRYARSIGRPDKSLIVLIKPGKKSTYRNLVDILDEMAISNVETYAITEISPDDKKLLR